MSHETESVRPRRLQINTIGDDSEVILDWRIYTAKFEHALFLALFLKARTRLFGSELQGQSGGTIIRPDRVRIKVMKEIRLLSGLIESRSKKGYRLIPELLG